MVLKRLDIAAGELQPRAARTLGVDQGKRQPGVLDQSFKRGEAFACLGGNVTLYADSRDQRFQAAAGLDVLAADVLGAGEDVAVDPVDVLVQPLQHVGGAVFDRPNKTEKNS